MLTLLKPCIGEFAGLMLKTGIVMLTLSKLCLEEIHIAVLMLKIGLLLALSKLCFEEVHIAVLMLKIGIVLLALLKLCKFKVQNSV